MRLKQFEAVGAAITLAAAFASTRDAAASTPPSEAPVTTEAPTTSEVPPTSEAPSELLLEAPLVSGFTVDGDAAEWADVPSLELTLEPIGDETVEPKNAVVKVAHDGENVFVLFQIEDDYHWDVGVDYHLTSSVAVEWAIDPSAGGAMGATDEDQETSLGMVDIWHYELGTPPSDLTRAECGAGEVAGGATSGPGAGEDPGNDEACNFDDEWSTNPEEREDDNGEGAENSLAGAWSHSDPTEGADGTWTFEMSRPLDTLDSTDAAFTVGGTGLLALAYWDPDSAPDGWEDDGHVQTANLGWITVTFAS
jgi:hypothetical protein